MSDETNDANAAPATRCCERDHDGDGNCDVHIAPGVFRKSAGPATQERIALSMTRDDYELLLLAMGFYMGAVTKEDRGNLPSLIGWVNRVNAGNRRFAPYA